MIKKIIIVFLLICFTFPLSGYVRPDVDTIDARRNAQNHNNLGLCDIANGDYYGAVQEFLLAIALNPNTQATAVYYNNLGETYLKLGYYKDAKECFEKAVNQYSLNFLYYQNLAKSYKLCGLLSKKINECRIKSRTNPLSMILLGLCYIESGQKRAGVIKLDEFCMSEPDLIITESVREYLKEVAKF